MSLEKIKKALEFYANSDNYWSTPLALKNKYCQRTLRDVREAEKSNEVLQDRGKLAREALKEFSKDEETAQDGKDPVIAWFEKELHNLTEKARLRYETKNLEVTNTPKPQCPK